MELKNTAELMNSDNYKERFKGEYYQLKIRRDNLSKMLKNYREGNLLFKPNCPYDLLRMQLACMDYYLSILEQRAKLEKININMEDK